MAHLLEMIDGKAQMFSVKKTPWHGLGVILDEPPTAEDAIVSAGLNWEVEKKQSLFMDANGIMRNVTDQFAVVRKTDQRLLGHAGKTWQPLQNKDAFKFFDPFVQAGEASYETAGSLEDGKRIWIMAKVKRQAIEVVKGDEVEKFILLTNCHKAGYAVTGGLTPIRVVCNNTLTGAMMSEKSRLFKANHSYKMVQRLEDIQATIAQADAAFEKAADAYRMFAKKKLTKDIIEAFLSQTFEFSINVDSKKVSQREKSWEEKQTENIIRLMETGRGSDIKGVRGTMWGLYNATTEMIAHEQGKNEDARLKSAWFGAGMQMNQRAFKSALLLAA